MRILLAVLALTVSGCRYHVIRQAASNPLAGSPTVGLLPFVWDKAIVDGDVEARWLHEQDAETRAEWPKDKATFSDEFARTLGQQVGGRVHLISGTEAATAAVQLKATVLELETGGYRPLKILLRIELLDAQGKSLEEISTNGEAGGGFGALGLIYMTFLQNRLAEGGQICGGRVGHYLVDRADEGGAALRLAAQPAPVPAKPLEPGECPAEQAPGWQSAGAEAKRVLLRRCEGALPAAPAAAQ